MKQIKVHRNRTNVVLVDLGFDVSNDVITSEIRTDKEHGSQLLASWQVTFVDDGTDGQLRLTLDDSATANISKDTGYMDMKRVSGGEPLSVFDEPLEVIFQGTVTA